MIHLQHIEKICHKKSPDVIIKAFSIPASTGIKYILLQLEGNRNTERYFYRSSPLFTWGHFR